MIQKILLSCWILLWSLVIWSTFAVEQPTEGFWSIAPVVENGPNLPWVGDNVEGKLIDVVKGFVNWTLGLLGLIALIVLMRWGFQMLTAAWDETKFGNWFTYLKNAAIWLAIIWFAWFIVSIAFWLANTLWTSAEGTSWSTLN